MLFYDSFASKGKQLVITDGELILSKPLLLDLASVSPCTHKEADTHMLLHAHHAALQDHSRLLIRTVDTDVVILAISVVQKFGA